MLHSNFFSLLELVWFHSTLSFWLRLIVTEHFKTKTCFFIHIHSSVKFYMVCFSQPLKIWWQISVQSWSTLFDLSFWIATKQNICEIKAILNNTVYIYGKNSEKFVFFCFCFFKRIPLIKWFVYVSAQYQ